MTDRTDKSLPVHRDAADVRAVRDCLAEAFSVAVSEETATVLEALEERLARTTETERWRPLREAIDLVRELGPRLRAAVDVAVRAGFDAKLAPDAAAFSATTRFSVESLSLVSDLEVQVEIAIGNTGRRLGEAGGDDFYVLNSRLASLLGREAIANELSPAHPRVFARALFDCLSSRDSSIETRLAAYAAFDPVMLRAVPLAFRAANGLLVKKGVLPDLRRSYGAPQQLPGARSSAQPPSAGPPGVPQPPAATTPQGLFDRILRAASARPAPATALPAPPGLVTVQVRPELVEALRSLEARLEARPGGLAAALAQASPAADAGPDATTPSNEVVLRARDEMAAMLTPADAVVADLVAAMFDRIFDDPKLSQAAKVQLARLQLPVFKAVLADRDFFTDPAHPIRGLIDAIAELGAAADSAVVDGRRPGEWLEAETGKLLEREQFDTAGFEAARDQLISVVTRHHDAVAGDDELVRSTCEEEEELAAVRDASLELAHRITASGCPEAAASFAYRAWRPVLIGDARVAARGSPLSEMDLGTLDDLLWILTPHAGEADRKRTDELLPSLRYRMWQAQIRAQLPAAEIESLQDDFDRLLGGIRLAPAAAAMGEWQNTAHLGPSIVDDLTTTLHVSSQEATDEGVMRGSWFEITGDDGTVRRARLTWISPVQGTCVFKDIAHNRSFAISLADLRVLRAKGKAALVDGPGVANSSILGALEDVARERSA